MTTTWSEWSGFGRVEAFLFYLNKATRSWSSLHLFEMITKLYPTLPFFSYRPSLDIIRDNLVVRFVFPVSKVGAEPFMTQRHYHGENEIEICQSSSEPGTQPCMSTPNRVAVPSSRVALNYCCLQKLYDDLNNTEYQQMHDDSFKQRLPHSLPLPF